MVCLVLIPLLTSEHMKLNTRRPTPGLYTHEGGFQDEGASCGVYLCVLFSIVGSGGEYVQLMFGYTANRAKSSAQSLSTVPILTF